jgi:hypothetical protein
MLPLTKDLQSKKTTIKEFIDLCLRVLYHLPNVLSNVEEKGGYKIYSSDIAGTLKYVRPINKTIFIEDPTAFTATIPNFEQVVDKIKKGYWNFQMRKRTLLTAFCTQFNNQLVLDSICSLILIVPVNMLATGSKNL